MALTISGETLDTVPPPTAPVDFGSQTIQNLGDPVNAQDGATKSYVVNRLFTTSDILPSNASRLFVDNIQLNAGAALTIPSTSGVFVTAPSRASVPLVLPSTIVQVTSTVTVNTGVAADVTGLSFAAAAGSVYEIDYFLRFQSLDGSGMAFTVTCTAAGATGQFYVTTCSGLTTSTDQTRVLGTLCSTIGNAAGDLAAWGRAIVVTAAAAGNIKIQMSRVTGNTVVFPGSRMTVTKLA